ncbi:hypothetical protein PINS_up002425 [Pythium insidiosum]|nr:hypothetical protein PINS_up002425 [Pythium insidiosum]
MQLHDNNDNALFLGLDCSTQSMTAVVTDIARRVMAEHSLRFDDVLPKYRVTNGVRRDVRDDCVVLVPSLMLVDALDAILQRLQADENIRLEDIVAISGSAQQHTSAFWRRGFSLSSCFATAPPEAPLAVVLERDSAFALECGPSWMDSSTSAQCLALETALGGSQRVAEISGSRAYARFTGNQIAKRISEDASFLDQVGRISLASSLLASLLIGDFAPVDQSDASGMNLMDVSTKSWSLPLLQATVAAAAADEPVNKALAERLRAALGESTVPSHSVVGRVHQYFQHRFGLRGDCAVVAFSGDNPCTLAGIGLSRPGTAAVSLGTSSTVLAVVPASVDTARAADEGHFFVNPVDTESLMVRTWNTEAIHGGVLTQEKTLC